MRKILVVAALAVLSNPVAAAQRTVTLSVPTMYCEVCPITVKKALIKVPGVEEAKVDFKKRQATVTFDDAKTSVKALTRATKDAGYPSTLAATAK